MSDSQPTTPVEPTPQPPPNKPGWKTTEFWMNFLVSVVSSLVILDIFPTGWPAKIVALAAMTLTNLGYQVARTKVKAATVASLLVIGLLLGAGSGCTKNDRRDTIQATVLGADGAAAGIIAYDRRHQMQLVADAQTKAEGRAALDAYRAERDKAVALLVMVYRAAYAASVANDAKSLSDLKELAAQLITRVNALTGGAQ